MKAGDIPVGAGLPAMRPVLTTDLWIAVCYGSKAAVHDRRYRPNVTVHERMVAIPSKRSASRLILELPISFNHLTLFRECHLQRHPFPLLGSIPDVDRIHMTELSDRWNKPGTRDETLDF
ncbi:hypothetical protein D3C76_1111600 [compost metagenome]